jgi:hypothetical protein
MTDHETKHPAQAMQALDKQNEATQRETSPVDTKAAEAKRIEDNKRAEEERNEQRRKTAEQRELVPDANGNVIMEVIMGPYRGNYLTMTAVDAEEAKDSHWARDPGETDRDHDHVLTEEDRQSALTQAHAWAQAQWDAAQGVDDDEPPEGETEEARHAREEKKRQREREHNERAMQSGNPKAGYQTRTAAKPQPNRTPDKET